MNLQEYCTHIQFSRCGAAHLGALQYCRPLPPRPRTVIQSRVSNLIYDHLAQTRRMPSRVILPHREYGELLASLRAAQRVTTKAADNVEHLIFHTVPIYPGPVYAPEIYA